MSAAWPTRLVELEVCDSTSDEAARLAAAGAPHGTCVVARAQREGRGRLGRAWYSPPADNLYLSCVVRPGLPVAAIPPITLAVGVAVAEAVNAAGARASLKWPNDVRVDGMKLAGILTEMSTRAGQVDHVVIGIGVNLATLAFPPELASIATSLARVTGRAIDRAGFQRDLLGRLGDWIDRFVAGGVASVAPRWWQLAERGRVRAEVGGREVIGEPRGLGPDGCLELDCDGVRVRVVAGDVVGVAP